MKVKSKKKRVKGDDRSLEKWAGVIRRSRTSYEKEKLENDIKHMGKNKKHSGSLKLKKIKVLARYEKDTKKKHCFVINNSKVSGSLYFSKDAHIPDKIIVRTVTQGDKGFNE